VNSMVRIGKLQIFIVIHISATNLQISAVNCCDMYRRGRPFKYPRPVTQAQTPTTTTAAAVAQQ